MKNREKSSFFKRLVTDNDRSTTNLVWETLWEMFILYHCHFLSRNFGSNHEGIIMKEILGLYVLNECR